MLYWLEISYFIKSYLLEHEIIPDNFLYNEYI